MDGKRIENLRERATREATEKLDRGVDHQEIGFDLLNDDHLADLYAGLSSDDECELVTSIVKKAQSRLDDASFGEDMKASSP